MFFGRLRSAQATGSSGIPTGQWGLRRWLRELPLADPGEATRSFFNGLQQLNDTPLPASQRLRLMRLVRHTGEALLQDLSRQLGARQLPLSAKGRKALHLSQALHHQLAQGYVLAVQDAQGKHAPLAPKPLAEAVHCALTHLGEILLESARVYAPDPQGIWRDVHQLYALAEEHGIADRQITDTERPQRPRSSITELYLQTCLLAICNPQGLRQGEAQRLAR